MAFFSSIKGRKEAKEDQGVRDASQFGRVDDESNRVPGNPAERRPPPRPSPYEEKKKRRAPPCRGREVWPGTSWSVIYSTNTSTTQQTPQRLNKQTPQHFNATRG